MRVSKSIRNRARVVTAVVFCLAVLVPVARGDDQAVNPFAVAKPVEAVNVSGTVLDEFQNPLVGYRVLFRSLDQSSAFASFPTNGMGGYHVALPGHGSFVAVALVCPQGRRHELDGNAAVVAQDGAILDIASALVPPIPFDPPLRGGDRLFLSFIEDTVVTDRSRVEGWFESANADSDDRLLLRASFVHRFRSLPGIEFGARIGGGSVDFSSGDSESGLTDLDLWGKLRLGQSCSGRTAWGVGGRIVLPTASIESGLGFEALRSELFGAYRYTASWATIAARAGVWFNEGTVMSGYRLDGEIAPTAGIGLLFGLGPAVEGVAEASWEGKRFENGEPDGRILAGVNWVLFRRGSLRAAIAFGLTDGAPDTLFSVGYAYPF